MRPAVVQTEEAKELRRHIARAKRYGMTAQQLDKLFAMDPFCWICRREAKPGKPRYVDHDHKTKRVRGVLCHRCNYRLLGRGLEDPTLHAAAAVYLDDGFDGRYL
jgi:DNA-directed RNA polymerase subunit RPC12/RpoP